MNWKLNLSNNIIVSWMRIIIYLFIAFFTTPILIHKLGDNPYGIWILIGSITGYFGLFDFGIRITVVKYVAEYSANKDQRKLNALSSTSIFIFLCFAILITISTIIVCAFYLKNFNIPKEYLTVSQLALLIMGLNMAVNFPLSIFGGILGGLQKIALRSYIDIASLILRTAVILILVYTNHGIVSLAIVSALFITFTNLLYVALVYKILPSLQLNFALVNKSVLRQVFGFSLFIFMSLVGTTIITKTDSVIIGIFLPVASITIFSIAQKFPEYIGYLQSEFIGALFPAISQLIAVNDVTRRNKLFILSSKLSLAFFLPICISLMIMGKALISLWVGNQYIDAYNILVVLIISSIISIFIGVSNVALLAINKQKLVGIISIGQAVINILLCILFLNRVGLIGVAWAHVASYTLVALFTIPYTCKAMKIGMLSYIRDAFLVLIVPIGFASAIMYLFIRFFSPSSIVFLACGWGLATGAYIVVYYMLAVSMEERTFINSVLIKSKTKINKLMCRHEEIY